jgi:hypothetical protein
VEIAIAVFLTTGTRIADMIVAAKLCLFLFWRGIRHVLLGLAHTPSMRGSYGGRLNQFARGDEDLMVTSRGNAARLEQPSEEMPDHDRPNRNAS